MSSDSDQKLIDTVDDLQIEAKYNSHAGTYYLTLESIMKIVALVQAERSNAVLDCIKSKDNKVDTNDVS